MLLKLSTLSLVAKLWLATWDMPDVEEVGPVPLFVVHKATLSGVDPLFAWALSWRESRFRYWRVSSAGAIGPMQVIPRYHCEERPCDTYFDQIDRGLEAMVRYRAETYDGLRSYNCGRGGARQDPTCGSDYASDILRLVNHLETI